MSNRFLWSAVVALTFASIGNAQDFGRFVGGVTATWDADGRSMRLTEDFAYVDPAGKEWLAPRASEIDGASIPRVFWTVVGGPFEGQYRNASVVHDVACKVKKEKWQDVHRMFYNAMRCGGVSERRALTMYGAVYRFGPRWEEPVGFWGTVREKLGRVFGGLRPQGPPPPPPPPPVPPTEEDFRALEKLIEENKTTTPEEVERLLTKPAR